MKSLVEYILNEEKEYEFKIKLATPEVSSEMLDRVEHALSSFGVSRISKPKHLPITARNLDFPQHGACDIFLITVALKYPCTDDQIRSVLGSQGRISLGDIVVIPANQPEELRRDDDIDAELNPPKKKKDALLDTEIETTESGQPQVGTKRIESMMKELESRKQEFAAKLEPAAKSLDASTQNNNSPMKGIAK